MFGTIALSFFCSKIFHSIWLTVLIFIFVCWWMVMNNILVIQWAWHIQSIGVNVEINGVCDKKNSCGASYTYHQLIMQHNENDTCTQLIMQEMAYKSIFNLCLLKLSNPSVYIPKASFLFVLCGSHLFFHQDNSYMCHIKQKKNQVPLAK